MTGSLGRAILMMRCRSKPTDRGGAVMDSLSPAAERQRRYRRRRKRGLSVAMAEVPIQVVEALVGRGFLAEDEVSDPRCLGAALARAGQAWAGVEEK